MATERKYLASDILAEWLDLDEFTVNNIVVDTGVEYAEAIDTSGKLVKTQSFWHWWREICNVLDDKILDYCRTSAGVKYMDDMIITDAEAFYRGMRSPKLIEFYPPDALVQAVKKQPEPCPV